MWIIGKLKLDSLGHWEIRDKQADIRRTLSAGDVVQLLIGDAWIQTRVDETDGYFFATTRGLRLQAGLLARVAY